MNDAEQAKSEAMDRVEFNANEDWKRAAYETVVALAKEQPFLNSDDVIRRIPADVHTHNLSALGPVMKRAAVDGVIVKHPVPSVNSARRSRHAAPLLVWRSLLWRGA